ncbi:MAG: hypothetical protein K2Y40_08925 [Reyranella sp.]|nr:hypothetical protein [Reyranella sp.]
MSHAITFHDSYWYCYANSAAMLLSGIGEAVSPRLIEALTGVGLGASFDPPLPFFGELQPPDRGLSQALGLLGFSVDEEAAAPTDPAPLERLARGPAIIGPVDMCHLAYNPTRPRNPGVDHYILVLEVRDGRCRLHDPAGFAHVWLDGGALAAAWRADGIEYRRDAYRSWRNPRRVSSPTGDAIFDAAMADFRRLYREAEQRRTSSGACIGSQALKALQAIAADGALTPQQHGHLVHFGLPLGAKRALDYVAFFERRAPRLAELKQKQALAFGGCQTALVAGDRDEAGRHLGALAGLEQEFKAALLGA